MWSRAPAPARGLADSKKHGVAVLTADEWLRVVG
jgi:hypothetical protein